VAIPARWERAVGGAGNGVGPASKSYFPLTPGHFPVAQGMSQSRQDLLRMRSSGLIWLGCVHVRVDLEENLSEAGSPGDFPESPFHSNGQSSGLRPSWLLRCS
jgi:hypothetical protein